MCNKTTKEIKQKYFDRVYAEAETVECGCGCGEKMKNKDKYGRDKTYITGHNGRKYPERDKAKAHCEATVRYKKKNHEWCRDNKRERRTRKRDELLRYCGGKCSKCGNEYTGNNACIFDFHHIDPDTKEFGLGCGAMNNFSRKRIYEEAKKCVILCANCHRMTHFAKEERENG